MTAPTPSLIEDFKTALDFFFRRRPPLQALMWHIENKAANSTFVVPQGKIYEVFAYLSYQNLLDLNNRVIVSYTAIECWYPAIMYGVAYGSTDSAYWDGAAEVRYDNRANVTITGGRCMLDHGWKLTENEGLTSASAFVVRWRDVTHRQ